MVVKIRPPRFVSFTMELEPYSQKKAYALEILNDINLNVFEAETIHKMINLSTSAVIITGKRIICVYERAFDPHQEQGLVDPASNTTEYKHWNVFFKDIYRVTCDFVDVRTKKVIKEGQIKQMLQNE